MLLVVVGTISTSGCDPAPKPVTAAPEPGPSGPTRQYELRIASTPPGCAVRIDGEAVGVTPLKTRFDEPVAASVEVAAPGHKPAVLETGADWWQRSAAAKAAERFGRPVVVRTFNAQLEPVVLLRLVSVPSRATVTVDGESAGLTPTDVRWDGRRPLAVRLSLSGHAPHEEVLNREWWEEQAATATLDEDLGAQVVTVSTRLWQNVRTEWTRVGHTQRSRGPVKVAVQRGSSRRTVPATVVGPSGRQDVIFLYDTGATYTTLDMETAAAIGLDFNTATVELETRTANGVVTRPLMLLPEVRIGQHTVRNVAVSQCDSCRDGELIGLLGLNVLQEFATNVSPDGRQVTLIPASSGAGRMLSLKAFIEASLMRSGKIAVTNQCDRSMVGVVIELVQRDRAGKVAARVRTPHFSVAGGASESVDTDLSRLMPTRKTELLVVEGDWR